MSGEIPNFPSEFDQLPLNKREFFEGLAQRRPTMFRSGRQAYAALLKDMQTIERIESGPRRTGGFPSGIDRAQNYIDNLR